MARRQIPGHQKKRNAKARPISTSVGRPNAPGTLAGNEAEHGSPTTEPTEPQALVITHRFDPGDDGAPYAATIRLVGRLEGATGRSRAGDSFTHEEIIDSVVPGTGPITITSWVYGLDPGAWTVRGELIRPSLPTDRPGRYQPRSLTRTEPLQRASWSWLRWSVSAEVDTPVRTRWALIAPLARMPAVLPGSWTLLAAIGTIVALFTQALILSNEGVPVPPVLAVSLTAIVAGLVGAKLWYRVLHPAPWRESLRQGWSVDGFLIVMPVAAVVFLALFDLPVGVVLDASAPGIFFAVAIGRIGCFITGCCAGRCTRSRWGLWSSDRRIGARRIPAQLLESFAGLAIGIVALLLVLWNGPWFDGMVFLVSIGVYLVVRQLLLRIRAESRRYSWRRSHLDGITAS